MPRLGYVAERLKTMDIMNEHEVCLSFEQLEELVTLMKNEGANGDDFVYLTDLGRRGVFATHAHRTPDHYGDTMTYYRNYHGNGFYRCNDCRKCVHSEIQGWNVMCLRDVDDGYDPINVGICNDELVEGCSKYVEVIHA